MIGVVHLVWGPLGTVPLRRFLDSYRANPAGVEHELIVMLNGVSGGQRPQLIAELEGIEHRLLTLEQPVQDLAAYGQASARLGHERLCFLNSYSVILASQWLAKLDRALEKPGAGLVGATGSWASVRSSVMHQLLLPSPYRGVIPGRSIARAEVYALERELESESRGDSAEEVSASTAGPQPPRRSFVGKVLATLKTLPQKPEQLLRFQGFPAAHLRTNAFLIERATFAALKIRPIERKMDAYLMESGRASFTRQIERRGLRVLVVDSDGEAYEHEDWPRSHTLWQGDQEGLLIADNQTRTYARGGIDRRRLLSAFAWGPRAEPAPPSEGSVDG